MPKTEETTSKKVYLINRKELRNILNMRSTPAAIDWIEDWLRRRLENAVSYLHSNSPGTKTITPEILAMLLPNKK